ncbi:MAG: hypothetical protein OXQ31_23955 [Spirochaetaceae bacterium]|nr:hypothetical protein [Spirochaetaceae bacterium]MDE0221150.1 hypothetical protein [Spirochaetaceae bacterium]
MHHLTWRLRGVRVTALIGRSGTGKSFRAQLIATRHGMDLIIDDGLLIRNQKILGGRSAKVANNALAAVKTAVFHDPRAAQGARRRIAAMRPRRVLVLGTSARMVQLITRRLALPAPHRYLHIEEIASRAEIDAARAARESEGKHIIPVPPVEVRRDYAHMAIDAIRIFWQRGVLRNKGMVFEKTEVIGESRGAVSVSEAALTQMVAHCLHEHDPSLRLARVIVSKSTGAWALEVIVDVPSGAAAGPGLHDLRELIMSSLQRYAGLVLSQVDVTVGSLLPDADGYPPA